MWHTLLDRFGPGAARRIMAGVGHGENFETLRGQAPRDAGPAVGRLVHDALRAGAAVRDGDRDGRIDFFLGRVEPAVNVPIVAVAVESRGHLFHVESDLGIRRLDREPLLPNDAAEIVLAFASSGIALHPST